MFSGLSSLIWGNEGDGRQPTTDAKSPNKKKSLTEQDIIVGSDGDDWVLITDGPKTKKDPSKKNVKARTESTSSTTSTGSGSPRAKKSRRKESDSPGTVKITIGPDNHVPIVVKKLNPNSKLGKIHRRQGQIVQKDFLVEGDRLLAEIDEEKKDFPTIEEAEKVASKSARSVPCPGPSPSSSSQTPITMSYAAAIGMKKSSSSSPSSSPSLPVIESSSTDGSSSLSSSATSATAEPSSSPAILIVSNNNANNNNNRKSKKGNRKMHGLIGRMEGSWFVTPPACFTKPNTFNMEESPIEDLLIETPPVFRTSMTKSVVVEEEIEALRAPSEVDEEERRTPIVVGQDMKETPPSSDEEEEDVHHHHRVGELLLKGQAGSPLSEVQLNSYTILSRREKKGTGRYLAGKNGRRKGKKGGKGQDAQDKDATSVDNPNSEKGSGNMLATAVRARAFEPIRQEMARQIAEQRSPSFKLTGMTRQNMVSHGLGGLKTRKDKYASRPHTYNVNRKTHKHC